MRSILLYIYLTLIAASLALGIDSPLAHIIGKARYTRWDKLDEILIASALNECLDSLTAIFLVSKCPEMDSSDLSKNEIVRVCQLEEDDPFLDYFLETGEITGTLLDSFMNETAAAEHIMSAKRIVMINKQCNLNETTIRTEKQEIVESNLFEANDDTSVLYMFSDARWIPVEDCTRTPTEKIYTCRERSRPIHLHSRRRFQAGIAVEFVILYTALLLMVLIAVAAIFCLIKRNFPKLLNELMLLCINVHRSHIVFPDFVGINLSRPFPFRSDAQHQIHQIDVVAAMLFLLVLIHHVKSQGIESEYPVTIKANDVVRVVVNIAATDAWSINLGGIQDGWNVYAVHLRINRSQVIINDGIMRKTGWEYSSETRKDDPMENLNGKRDFRVHLSYRSDNSWKIILNSQWLTFKGIYGAAVVNCVKIIQINKDPMSATVEKGTWTKDQAIIKKAKQLG